MEPLDLLAVAPHPDDAELLCGGTLALMADRGYRVGILDLTAGEMGTRGTVAGRRSEAERAAKIAAAANAARDAARCAAAVCRRVAGCRFLISQGANANPVGALFL